jgi:hypothetical protein
MPVSSRAETLVASIHRRGGDQTMPPFQSPRPASPPAPAPARVVVTLDDLLWFKTSEDEEGRITLGLLACPHDGVGVLVDDNGESLGLRLSRAEAQDLHRALVGWLAGARRPSAA